MVTTNLSKLLKVKCARCQAELALCKRFMLEPDFKKWDCHNCGCAFAVYCSNVKNRVSESFDVLIKVHCANERTLLKFSNADIAYDTDKEEWYIYKEG